MSDLALLSAVSHACTDLGARARCQTEYSLLTADSIMNKLSMAAIAVLLVSVMFIGAQSRKTLGTVDVATIEAMEHQRILAELEEVHQLRERMLQQGKFVDFFVPIKCPDFPLIVGPRLLQLLGCWCSGNQRSQYSCCVHF